MNENILNMLRENKEIYEPRVVVNTYTFRLTEIDGDSKISVTIYYCPERETEPYEYSISHHIHTPTQASPYTPSITQGFTEEQLLMNAIAAVTGYIKHAKQEGYTPTSDWLKPNPTYHR